MLFSRSTAGIRFPFGKVSRLDGIRKLFKNPDVWRACKNSLIIACVSTFISTVIGTAAALAIEKYRFRIRNTLIRSLYLPLIIPDIVLAIALLTFYVQVKFPRGLTSVIFAHVVFNIAYVTIIVRARLQGYDDTIEEAALDLGANKWQTFWRITFPSHRTRHNRRCTACIHTLH